MAAAAAARVLLALGLMAVANAYNIVITIHNAIPTGTLAVSCTLNGHGLGSQGLAPGGHYVVKFPDDDGKSELVLCSFHAKLGSMQAKLWDVKYGGAPHPCQYCQWFVRSHGLYYENFLIKRWP